MKKLSIGIERNYNTDINVFQTKLRELIISKQLVPYYQALEMDLIHLLNYVVVIYMSETDYKTLTEQIQEIIKQKNVS